jgi:hypothetical protein
MLNSSKVFYSFPDGPQCKEKASCTICCNDKAIKASCVQDFNDFKDVEKSLDLAGYSILYIDRQFQKYDAFIEQQRKAEKVKTSSLDKLKQDPQNNTDAYMSNLDYAIKARNEYITQETVNKKKIDWKFDTADDLSMIMKYPLPTK